MDKVERGVEGIILREKTTEMRKSKMRNVNKRRYIRRYRNNFSGLRAAGYRFRFRVQAISHRALYLPAGMREDSSVKRLLAGEAPCRVFGTSDIHEAREAFNRLRMRYDFPYWAATQYPVRDLEDPDEETTLDLNQDQHMIADRLLKKLQEDKVGRFLITKNGRPRGVSTCVQAYIMWLQLYHTPKNSQTCGFSGYHMGRFKENIARYFGKYEVNYGRYKFPIRDRQTSAYFNTMNKPDSLRGIDFGYVHLIDMSKWRDSEGTRSNRAMQAAMSGILHAPGTLIVLEGNEPSAKYNPSFYNQVSYAESRKEGGYFELLRLPD